MTIYNLQREYARGHEQPNYAIGFIKGGKLQRTTYQALPPEFLQEPTESDGWFYSNEDAQREVLFRRWQTRFDLAEKTELDLMKRLHNTPQWEGMDFFQTMGDCKA